MPYGVSNSCKRAPMKTYTRRPNRFFHDDYSLPVAVPRMDERNQSQRDKAPYVCAPEVKEKPNKVIRFEKRDVSPSPTPSSPLSPSENPFSDPISKLSMSPPSSPPSRQISPPAKSYKPAFSFLKRKRSANQSPLTEVDSNAIKEPPAKKPRLTQMQIDLGGQVNRTCKACGMEYIPSHSEDAALHREFHKLNIGGVELGRGFVKEVGTVQRFGEGESIVLVDRTCSVAVRRKVARVLDVVTKDLGAVEIAEARLWGGLRKTKRSKQAPQEEDKENPQFKVFLYCVGDKCVGLCLVERIRTASKVIDSESLNSVPQSLPMRSSSILTERTKDAMLLGISRIWTSKSHRLKGIASLLLDCARGNFFYGIEVPKQIVAFSQPTESGGLLAERWYGKKIGWHVYTDSE